MPDRAADRPRPSRFKKLLLSFAVFVLCLIVAVICLDRYGRASFNRALREAQAMGQPVTFAEILARRHVWPAEQDGGKAFLQLVPRLDALADKSDLLRPLPIVGEANTPPIGHRWSSEQVKAVTDGLARMSVELGELDAIGKYPGGSLPFPAGADPAQRISAILPELARLRFAIKLKALDAEARTLQGDASHLAEDVEVMVRISGLLSEDPTLICYLVKVACDALTVDVIQRSLAVAKVQPSDLRLIEARLSEMELDTAMYWAVLGERAYFVEMGGPLARSGMSVPSVSGLTSPVNLPGWNKIDLACGIRTYNLLVAVASQPSGIAEEIDRADARVQGLSRLYVFTKMSLASVLRGLQLGLRTTAAIRAARVGQAMERYRLETGQFPQQLEQLVPMYLAKVPTDPIDDKPLRYRLTEKAAIIYSIGDDGTDNGGDVSTFRTTGEASDWGFVLLRPQFRNLPPVPTTQTSESKPG